MTTQTRGSTLSVDWLRCDGHGVCAELAPEIITLDDWGYPIVHHEVNAATERVARKAVELCPALALRLSPPR
jgi:ferredoxin